MIGNSDHKINVHLKTNSNIIKNKISEIIHTGGFYDKVPRSLIKTSVPIMKNVVAPIN